MTGRTVTAVTTTPLDPEPQPPADATHVSDWELYDDQGVFRYHSTDCGHGVALSGVQSFDGTSGSRSRCSLSVIPRWQRRPVIVLFEHNHAIDVYFPYAESSGAVDVTRYTQPCLPKSAVPTWRRA